MNKKGQTESLSFLIGIIVTVIVLAAIVVAVVTLFYDVNQAKKDMTICYQDLVEQVKNIKDGEIRHIICQSSDDYALILFSNFAAIAPTYSGMENNKLWLRPNSCGTGSCLCLCDDSTSSLGVYDCTDNLEFETCENIDWLEKLRGFIILDKPIKRLEFIPLLPERDYFFSKANGNFPLYVERKGNTMGICLEPPCIGKEIDYEELAINIYENIIKKYADCLEGQNSCSCGQFVVRGLPDGYRILLNHELKAKDEFRISLEKKRPFYILEKGYELIKSQLVNAPINVYSNSEFRQLESIIFANNGVVGEDMYSVSKDKRINLVKVNDKVAMLAQDGTQCAEELPLK